MCPCCHGNHLKDAATIYAISVLLAVNAITKFHCLATYLICKAHANMDGVHLEILDYPLTEPLSPVETALQLHLVRRSMLQSPTKDVLVAKTSGKVNVILNYFNICNFHSHSIRHTSVRLWVLPALRLTKL